MAAYFSPLHTPGDHAIAELLRHTWIELIPCTDAQEIISILASLLDVGWEINHRATKAPGQTLDRRMLLHQAVTLPCGLVEDRVREDVVVYLLDRGMMVSCHYITP